MINLLGLKPLPSDLARFECLRARLERETRNGAVSKSAVLRYALKCAVAGIAANDVPHSPLGERRRGGGVELGASD